MSRLREDGVFDVSAQFSTVSELCEADDPAAALSGAQGEWLGSVGDILANTPPEERDPAKPWLIAPIDLQAIKAAGVTFAISMLERVIEERARGNPDSAARIRGEMAKLIGADLKTLKPGSAEAMKLKAALIARGPLVAISRSRHRAGRGNLHQGAADVGGRDARRRRVSREFAME